MSFLPYLTLHMQQLGMTMEEIAVIYAVLPLASLLGPPIMGKPDACRLQGEQAIGHSTSILRHIYAF